MEIDDIESKIACNELTAAQVFTQMKQHINKCKCTAPLIEKSELGRDSLNIELEKLELKDGDILIVKYSDAMSSVDLVDFTERLIKSPAAQGKKDIQIVLVAGDMDIKAVDEKAMNEAGWFSLPCEKEKGVGGLADNGLYKALDRLYERGWQDKHKEKDYDPRGTVEWGVVETMFKKQKSI